MTFQLAPPESQTSDSERPSSPAPINTIVPAKPQGTSSQSSFGRQLHQFFTSTKFNKQSKYLTYGSSDFIFF